MCKMQLNKRNWHVITNIGIFFAILFGAFFLISSNVYAAMDETEPNDNMTQANTVKVGETVYGTTGQWPKNNDYYKIIPPVSGDIKIDAYADDPSGKDSIYVAIISSDGDEIMYDWDLSDNPSGTSLVFSVISGNTYYVYVADSGGEDLIDYHLVTGYSIGKTSIKSVKRKKKAFTVRWDKKAKASFYEVQYVRKSVYSDYNWTKAKTIKVSRKLRSKTISKLKKNKKYYVRVRVARTIEGVTYYSNWSPKKLVRTK